MSLTFPYPPSSAIQNCQPSNRVRAGACHTWSAQQQNRSGYVELLHDLLDRDRDSNSRDGDEVMAACMADTRERIHLAVDAQREAAVAALELCEPGSLEQVMRGHFEVVLGHKGR